MPTDKFVPGSGGTTTGVGGITVPEMNTAISNAIDLSYPDTFSEFPDAETYEKVFGVLQDHAALPDHSVHVKGAVGQKVWMDT